MGEFTDDQRKELAELMISAVIQANSERRKEDINHHCFCASPIDKERHDKDHEALHKLCAFLDKIEKTKLAFAFALITVIAGALGLALWEGIKSLVKK